MPCATTTCYPPAGRDDIPALTRDLATPEGCKAEFTVLGLAAGRRVELTKISPQ